MNLSFDAAGDEEVQFFGRVSASVSHEIKNVLAIVNETAGLLEDLSLMAEQGIPLDPARLKALSGKIKKQVRRADKIVKNMNRFAHSADSPRQDVDLGETLTLMCALVERVATMSGVTLQPKLPGQPVKVVTAPFVLNHILWMCLETAIHAAGAGHTIDVILSERADCVRVKFKPLKDIVETPDGLPIFSNPANALFDGLGASLATDAIKKELILTLPHDLNR